jgi:hypothetical protein
MIRGSFKGCNAMDPPAASMGPCDAGVNRERVGRIPLSSAKIISSWLWT